MKKKYKNRVVCLHGHWCLCLPDPFRRLPYLPLDAVTIAAGLDIHYRTALRICKGERPLSAADLRQLQWLHFGAIPDPGFFRAKFYIQDGVLRTHAAPGYELGPGDLLEMVMLREQYALVAAELQDCKRRLVELTTPPPSNVVAFPRRKRGRPDDAG